MNEQLTFPHGRLTVHGENAINTDATRVRAAETTAILNEPHNLEAIVANPDRAIFHELSPDGVHLSILRPTGPYTDRALMTGIYDRELKEKGETHWVYDYPEEDQRKYWEIVLAGIHAGVQILDEEGRNDLVKNVYVENSTHVSDITQRTSRTIRFPHGHFIEIDPERIHPTTSAVEHVGEEQGMLQRYELVERFWARVLQRMPEQTDLLLPEFDVRTTAPFGYQFSVDGEFNPDNIARLTQVMAAHHEAFTGASELAVSAGKRAFSVDAEFRNLLKPLVPGDDPEQRRVLKSPSYRLYLALNNGKLDVIISPEFWSYGGVLEAMNINLDRDSSHAQFPMDQRLDFERRFAEKVTQMIDPHAMLEQPEVL